jgi:hypothetical protein
MSTRTFGQHRGKPLSDPSIPDSYLDWAQTARAATPDVVRAIKIELARRRGEMPLEAVSREPVAGVVELERKLAARADDPVVQRVLGAALAFVRTMEGG